MTKVVSFATIALLALGEGASFAYAVTEETTTSTTANEEVLKTQETDASIEEAAEVSSDKVEEVKEEVAVESKEEPTEESTSSSTAEEPTESTEEKEEKKTKGKTPRDASDPVSIPDNNLYQILREILNRPTGYNQNIPDGTAITKAQMEMLTHVNRTGLTSALDRAVISNLEGLQYATNLESFVLSGKNVEDTFTSLPAGFSNLKKLKELKFSWGELNNIDELKDHPALTVFYAVQNKLDSLEGLSGCTELEEIILDGSENWGYAQNGNIQNFKGLEKSEKLKKISFKKYSEQRTQTELGNAEPTYVGKGLQSLEGLNCAKSLETLELTGHPGLHTLDGLENYSKLKTLRVIGSANYNGRDQYYTNPGGVNDKYFDPSMHTPTYHKRGLRGPNAIDALKNCTSLEVVNLSGQAIEDISSLSGKGTIKELNLSVNLIETLSPLATTNNLVNLNVSKNLLTNLTGLENASNLQYLNAASQNAGAYQFLPSSSVGINEIVLRGLLKDISALNSTNLVEVNFNCNRLEDLSSLKNAANLKELTAYNNNLSDIKGDLTGCSSLEIVYFNNNMFANFKDLGLESAHDSLKELSMDQQGLDAWTYSNYSNGSATLVSLEGLEKFTIVEYISMSVNQIKDSEMKYIPKCLKDLRVDHNELQDKAFSTFTQADYPRLFRIYGGYNHISDITPLEKFTTLTEIYMPTQTITVPKHGGKVANKTSSVGFEVDVLKSDYGEELAFTKKTGWGTTAVVPTVKTGTNILEIEDPEYSLDGRSPGSEFTFKKNSALSGLTFDGTIYFAIDYDLGTKVELSLIPTDIEGNELKQVEQGETIYWRLNVKGENANFLRSPTLYWHMGYDASLYTAHDVVDPYDVSTDPQHDQYLGGFRMEIDNQHEPLVDKWWRNDFLHNKINNDKKADIVCVTRVADNAEPGKSAFLQFSLSGDNFTNAFVNAAVPVIPSAGQELKMSVPERLDFGKDNQADKKAKTYGLSAKGYSSDEKTKGLKIRVTDTKKTTSRVDWEVVGKLSDLTNTNAGKLQNASASPKLTIGNISLSKVTNAGEASESTSPITTNVAGKGNPTWATSIDLTAGGSSTKLAEAPKADGEGVWDYNIPFDDVKLEVPANVNNQAGRTFNGKITWTLEDAL